MGNVHQPELWRDLYVMLGTSSAALIGLLLVVTSLHLDEIVNNPVYRIRARNNTFYLITLLVEAALVLTPQPTVALGAELTAITLLALLFHLRNAHKFAYKNREMGKRGGYSLYRAIAFIVSDLLGIAGGACLIELSNWGMYLVTASYVTLLVSVALNAWAIMLGVGLTEKITKANRGTARSSR